MKLSCYIIDDEPLAIEVLESHIDKIDRLEVAGTFENAVKAFQAVQSDPVDLIFLDIQMPGLTGIELLRTLRNPPSVIFTTAYREYAIEGFELDAVDYLLKPISFERFLKAMDKVFSRHLKKKGPAGRNRKEETEKVHFFIQVDKKKVKISAEEITFVESRRDYVRIVTEQDEIEARHKISDLEQKLRPAGIIRIHRSFLVSLEKIKSWSAREVEVAGATLPIGRTYKREVMDLLEKRTDML